MSDLVQLRLASAADACSVQTLLHRAFGCHALDAFVFSAATVELAVVQQWIARNEMYLCMRGNALLGVCRLSHYPQYGLVLSRLAVDPNSKGQKLGSALLDLAEREARALGHTHLTLKTPSQHPFLVDYYLTAGYRRQVENFIPGDRYVEAVLVKSLV